MLTEISFSRPASDVDSCAEAVNAMARSHTHRASVRAAKVVLTSDVWALHLQSGPHEALTPLSAPKSHSSPSDTAPSPHRSTSSIVEVSVAATDVLVSAPAVALVTLPAVPLLVAFD
eukprot:3263086-Rhodomonas_salina.1